MTLRNARILSSCNEASNKQEQKMNVNIKLEDNGLCPLEHAHNIPQPTPQQPIYPNVPQMQPQMANFTMQSPTTGESYQYPSAVPNIKGMIFPESSSKGFAPELRSTNPCQDRNIDLSQDILQKDLQIADLENKNKFMQLLLRIYQNNPLYINSIVVCKSDDFMDLVKLLTKCDKVDLILNEDIACSGCGADSKLIYISKILITKGDETKELKYGYNEAYSKLIGFGISTKIVY